MPERTTRRWGALCCAITGVLAALAVAPAAASAAGAWHAQSTFSTAPSVQDEAGAIAGDGTFVVAWQEQRSDTDYRLVTARRDRNGHFGEATELDSQPTPFTNLQVGADDAGNTLIVWCSGGLCSDVSQVSSIRFWRLPVRGSPQDGTVATEGFEPSLTVLPDGRALVAYAASDGVHVASADLATGGPTGGGLVTTTNVTRPWPAIAAATTGAAVVLLRDVDTEPNSLVLRAVRQPAGGSTWTNDETPLDTIGAGSRLTGFRLAMSPAGDAFAAWQVDTNEVDATVDPPDPTVSQASAIRTAYGAAGNPFGATTERTGAPGSFGPPAIAFDADRVAHLFYVYRDGAAHSILRAGLYPGTTPDQDADLRTSEHALGVPTITALRDREMAAGVVDGNDVLAWHRTGGTWDPVPQVVGAADQAAPVTALAAPVADAVMLWSQGTAGADWHVRFVPYDATAPSFPALFTPATVQAGTVARMDSIAYDLWSRPSVRWDFGDGGTGTGFAPTHTYAEKGERRITATATDAVGNETPPERRDIVVTAAPPAPDPDPDPDPGPGPKPDPPKEAPSTKPADQQTQQQGGTAGGQGGGTGSGAGAGTGAGGKGIGGSSNGKPVKRSKAELFPIGRVSLRRATVFAGYGILCDAAGARCTVAGVARTGTRKLGTFSLRIAPGRTALIRFRLSRSGYRLLVHKRKLRIRIAAAGVRGLPRRIVLVAPRRAPRNASL